MLVQLPTEPGTFAARHSPVQALFAQTPSTQLLLVHWLASEQTFPFAFFATQEPPEQKLELMQSESAAHVVLHPVPDALHVKGEQVTVEPATQVPMPLQVLADLKLPLTQDGPAHCVPAAYTWHAPAPLQKPVCPHVSAP